MGDSEDIFQDAEIKIVSIRGPPKVHQRLAKFGINSEHSHDASPKHVLQITMMGIIGCGPKLGVSTSSPN